MVRQCGGPQLRYRESSPATHIHTQTQTRDVTSEQQQHLEEKVYAVRRYIRSSLLAQTSSETGQAVIDGLTDRQTDRHMMCSAVR
jgi:hypothetical protein